MPAELTYTSLASDALGYLERENDASFIAQFPRLVMLAENRLAVELKILGEQIPVTGLFSPNSPTLAKPSGWREMISINVTGSAGRNPVLPRSYEYCRTYWPDQTKVDLPRFYADYDASNLLIVPTPDQAYAFEMVYYARITPLDTSHQTNWFTINTPQILLYAVMIEAHSFLKNWDQVDTWQKLYDRSMTAITHEDQAHSSDRTMSTESA